MIVSLWIINKSLDSWIQYSLELHFKYKIYFLKLWLLIQSNLDFVVTGISYAGLVSSHNGYMTILMITLINSTREILIAIWHKH